MRGFMAQRKGRRIVLLVASALGVALLVLGVLVWSGVFAGSGEEDPYTTTPVTNLGDGAEQQAEEENVVQEEEATKEVTVTPEDVSTIDIEPMGITVSYLKGVGGFSFEVLRSASGTQYVEFRNEALIGTKCTDDQGVFAAIIAKPSASEQETIDETTEVEGVTYGLSLSANTCTGDSALLAEYQEAFSEPFPLLKAISE